MYRLLKVSIIIYVINFIIIKIIEISHFWIKFLGDSKRALDEYISEICLGGNNTISIHNTCEDSLLASPIILDLVILAEICTRIHFFDEELKEQTSFNVILSILSYLLKAPLVPKGTV